MDNFRTACAAEAQGEKARDYAHYFLRRKGVSPSTPIYRSRFSSSASLVANAFWVARWVGKLQSRDRP